MIDMIVSSASLVNIRLPYKQSWQITVVRRGDDSLTVNCVADCAGDAPIAWKKLKHLTPNRQGV